MRNKIKSISIQIPKETTLPDGFYTGIWGGYIIELEFNDITFNLETEEGLRGLDAPVIVEIKKGEATFNLIKN